MRDDQRYLIHGQWLKVWLDHQGLWRNKMGKLSIRKSRSKYPKRAECRDICVSYECSPKTLIIMWIQLSLFMDIYQPLFLTTTILLRYQPSVFFAPGSQAFRFRQICTPSFPESNMQAADSGTSPIPQQHDQFLVTNLFLYRGHTGFVYLEKSA